MRRELLELVWSRASDRCEYCRFPATNAWLPFQIDHIIAEKHGGPTVAENLALSCFYCNSFKGPNIAGVDPEGKPDEAIQLYHPRNDIWAEHFEWDRAVLRGLTATGRATIAVLRVNSPEALEFRGLLLEIGHQL